MTEYFKTLKKLPSFGKVLALTAISGVIEGLGLSLFIPLINITSEEETTPWPVNFLVDGLNYLGIVDSLPVLALLVTLVLIISFYVSYIQNFMIGKSKMKFQHNLRVKLAGKLFNSSWEFYKVQSSGDLINRLTVQVDRASSCLNYQVLTLAFSIQMLVYFFISVILSPTLTMIVLTMLAVMSFGVNRITNNVTELGTCSSSSHMNYSSKLNEYIGGMKLLKVMAANNVILKRLENLSFRILRAYWNEEKSHALLAFYMRAGPIVVVSVIIVFSFEILELSGSVVLVFLFVLMRLVPSVTAVRQNYHSYKIHKPSLDVVDDLIILASNVSEDMRGIIKFNKLQDSIDFKNVGFRYSDSNHDTLKSISLKIKKNSTVGIVGLSGSGKTTLLDLLVGLYQPTKGAIEVDGVELNRYEITSWRKSIGYVTQDVLLFDESLRDNILLREKNASVENINAAIETAFLKNVISNLDEGLNTNIGEKGHRLSGGERQRIALARALLGGPSIVILDEATSSLDAESENTIRERIDAISHNYTIIVVTHKLSTVRNADYIYVMEEGEIVEHGNYTDLLKNTSRFQELHDLQNT